MSVMNVAEHRERALREYGLRGDGQEDPLYPHTLMLDLMNQALTGLVKESKCLKSTRQYELATTRNFVDLDLDVYDFEPKRVKVYYSDTWHPVVFRDKELLERSYGVMEGWSTGASDPQTYWTELAETGQRRLYFYPYPSTAANPGVQVEAYITAPKLTNDEDVPGLPGTDHDCLLPWIMWRIASREAARGRPDAPVHVWWELAQKAAITLKNEIERHRNPGPRGVRVQDWSRYWD